MTPAAPDSRRLTFAAVALFAVVVLVRSTPLALFGVDGACYARIARDLAQQPFFSWADVRWSGVPFHEHPPLALWVEACWFRLFGPSAAAAVWLARVYALALGAVVFTTARRMVDEAFAAFSLVALATLPAFVFESQNPMLEAPLTLAFAVALGAVARLKDSRWAALTFAVALVAAFWVKGVVALAAFGFLAWASFAGAGWRRVALAAGLAAGLLGATAAGYEAWCGALGVSSFFTDYAHHQLVTSLVEGRGNPVASHFYYGSVLFDWHLGLVLAAPVALYVYRRQSAGWRALVSLGLWHAVLLVVGFSVAKQKNQWYLAPLVPGAAWVIGGALRALTHRWLRVAPVLLGAVAVVWVATTLVVGSSRDTAREAAIRVVTATPLDAQHGTVANCSVLGEWVAAHLFAFQWNAAVVSCDSPATWQFDGRVLTTRTP